MVLLECPVRLKHWPRVAIAAEQLQGDQVWLTSEQRHYLSRVRRLQLGDPLLVFDGSGRLWQVLWQGEQAVIQQELQPWPRELALDLHLGLGVIKGGGWDEMIRQVTELGVAQISPLITERTLVQPGRGKQQRWQKIAREAAEQSERLRWPQIHPPLAWSTWLSQRQPSEARLLMAVARAPAPPLVQVLHDLPRSLPYLTIAIGPEGGWTEAEIQQGQEAGATVIGLGPRVLRAATAPVVVAAWVAALWEAETDHG